MQIPNIGEFARTACTTASSLGIKKFDIGGVFLETGQVKVENQKPGQISASLRSGLTVRVWNDAGQVGVVSTTDLGTPGISMALQLARDACPYGQREHAPDFSPEATAPITEKSFPAEELAPIPELLDTLLKAERDVLKSHASITSVPFNGLTQIHGVRFYLNSEGALREQSWTSASLGLTTRAQVGNGKPRTASASEVSRHLKMLPVGACVDTVVSKTLRHLDYRKVESGRYLVVFSPDAFLDILDAFSNAFDAQAVLDKQSLAKVESLGAPIASSLLSLSDDPFHPLNPNPRLFDGEGTPCRKVSLVEGGKLVGFLHSAGTAKRLRSLGAKPTGNARLGAKVTIGAAYYHVARGQKPGLERTLATEEKFVYVDEVSALHAGVKATQGSFSLPFDGWVVNRGEWKSVEAATVAGDFLTLLHSICFVGKEVCGTPRGVCPEVWVDGLSITGD